MLHYFNASQSELTKEKLVSFHFKQAMRVATQYAPAPLLPVGAPSASRAAK